jgi:hypothetical protein
MAERQRSRLDRLSCLSHRRDSWWCAPAARHHASSAFFFAPGSVRVAFLVAESAELPHRWCKSTRQTNRCLHQTSRIVEKLAHQPRRPGMRLSTLAISLALFLLTGCSAHMASYKSMNRAAKRAGAPHFDDKGLWVQAGPDGKDHPVPSPNADPTGPAPGLPPLDSSRPAP